MGHKSYFEAMFGELPDNVEGKTFSLPERDFIPLSSMTKENEEKLKEAYNKAHEIRKFEIELYWKRATYFWAFELVVFGGLNVLFSKYLDVLSRPVSLKEVLLALITISLGGYFISLLWYFVMQGSKFWQENWEKHIDLLEQYVSGNLYKCVLHIDTAHFSVSRASRNITFIFLIFWVSCSLCFCYKYAELFLYDYNIISVLIVIILIISYITWLLRNASRAKNYDRVKSSQMTIRCLPNHETNSSPK